MQIQECRCYGLIGRKRASIGDSDACFWERCSADFGNALVEVFRRSPQATLMLSSEVTKRRAFQLCIIIVDYDSMNNHWS